MFVIIIVYNKPKVVISKRGGIKMMRKIILCTIAIVILIVSSTPIAYANPNNITTEEYPFFRLNNLPRNMVINDPNLFISFNASEGSLVTISVYHNTSLSNDEERFVLLNEPSKVKVGNIQRGFAEVMLRKGTNRVDFKIDFEKGEELVVSRMVTVKDIEEVKKQVTEGILNGRNAIRNFFISTENSSRP